MAEFVGGLITLRGRRFGATVENFFKPPVVIPAEQFFNRDAERVNITARVGLPEVEKPVLFGRRVAFRAKRFGVGGAFRLKNSGDTEVNHLDEKFFGKHNI